MGTAEKLLSMWHKAHQNVEVEYPTDQTSVAEDIYYLQQAIGYLCSLGVDSLDIQMLASFSLWATLQRNKRRSEFRVRYWFDPRNLKGSFLVHEPLWAYNAVLQMRGKH